jgi:hypothetical protein
VTQPPASKPASTLQKTGAATIVALPSPKPASTQKPKLTFAGDDYSPKHKYQEPIVTQTANGTKTELHRYFTKVRPDGIYEYHIVSTTLEQPGRKPQVTHVCYVAKTDNEGKVTTQVHKHGDEMRWHAGTSKWNVGRPPIAGSPPPDSVNQHGSGKFTTGASYAEGVPWMSQALASHQLQDYYYDAADALAPFRVKLTVPLRKTIDLGRSSKKLYARFSTSNMQYGEWYLD